MQRVVTTMLALFLLGAACSSAGTSTDRSSPPRPAGAAGTTSAPSGSSGSIVSSPDPIEGCVPGCNPPGLVRPRPMTAGPYETEWFFGGEMVVTLDEPWSINEDSTGELSFELRSMPEDDVLFWEDVYPVRNGTPVRRVPMSVDGLLRWLRQDPRLDVSGPLPGTIGDLEATVVDVTVSGRAKNEDPNCPTDACVLFLGFPQWDGVWGIAEPQVQRFYLADVAYGGKTHLFVAVVYPDDPADMDTFLPHGEDLISTVRVPPRRRDRRRRSPCRLQVVGKHRGLLGEDPPRYSR